MDSWIVLKTVDNMGQTSRGDAKRGVQADNGKWLQLTGDQAKLESLRPGSKICHSEPKQYGKSFFATLKEVEQTNGAKPQGGTSQQAQSKRPNWATYQLVVTAVHSLACQLEPDEIKREPATDGEQVVVSTVVDRSDNRTKIMNTILIAYGKGDFDFDQEEIDAIIPF